MRSTAQYSPRETAVAGAWSRGGRLPMQEAWEIKSAAQYTTSDCDSPAWCDFLLPPVPLFLSILSLHLAAFQSMLINIQCLCTLPSCLSRWRNPWWKTKFRWQTRVFFLYATVASSSFIHCKSRPYKSINTCFWQEENDKGSLPWCSYQRQDCVKSAQDLTICNSLFSHLRYN